MDAASSATLVTFYFLGWRDVPAADRQVSWVSQREGTVVLLSSDGEILTVYRHRKALPTIRHKMKYRLPPQETTIGSTSLMKHHW